MHVVVTFEQVSTDSKTWSADDASSAGSLLRSITDFGFIAVFFITSNIMAYIQPLTVALQEKAKDIVQAYEYVRNVQETLQKLHDDVDAYQGQWWKEITEMSAKPLR